MKKYKIIMLALSLALLMAVIWFSNPLIIAEKIAVADHLMILAAFMLSFIAICMGVLKWKLLLGKIKYTTLFPIQVLGFTISNFTPGKAAEPAKAVILKIRSEMPVSFSLASIIWERILDVIVLLMFSMIALGSISVDSSFFLPSVISFAIFSILVILGIVILYAESFGRRLFSITRRLPILRRLPENFMDLFYKQGVPRNRIAKSFILTFFIWALLGFVLYIILAAFGAVANPVALTGIVALSVVIGIASSLPGGIGTTELVMIFLLGAVGVDTGTAAAVAITYRLVTIWFVNVLGGISFVYLSRKIDIKKVFR